MAEKLKKDNVMLNLFQHLFKVDKRGVDIKALQRQIKVLEGKIGNQQKALDENVDIKALQRQIKVLEGKIGNQQKALDENVERKVLGENIKALMDEYKIKSESLEKVISSKHKSKEKRFPTIVTAIGLIITFTICGFVYFSGDVITKWAENNLTKFAENKVQSVIDDLTIDLGERSNKLEQEMNKVLAGIEESKYLVRKWAEDDLRKFAENRVQRVIDDFKTDLGERSNILELEINTVLTEIEEKAEKSLDNLVTSLRKDESSKGLVASVSENVKGTDESKHATAIPEETIGKLDQIKENLAQVKMQEDEFSYANNPLYLQSELKIGDYTVIKSLDK
jgi:hypothetical protein